MIIVGKDQRFYPWDIDRWRTNRYTRDSNNKWVEGWLSRKYKDCPASIIDLIEHHHKNGLMLEFRRRGFEIDVLAREIVLRVRQQGTFPWGGTLPVDHALRRAKSHLAVPY